ncbi:MAG TPA: response regulator, partial [Thermodesulfobacteriota bacterium]|nr:response regulator [Thermodesulfobacteriota bacterium]
WKELKPYDLICLDIMMPEMDGQELLKKICSAESDMGVPEVKIIMTTALDDSKNIMTAFRNQCEAYLVKPIRREKVEEQLRAFGFLA